MQRKCATAVGWPPKQKSQPIFAGSVACFTAWLGVRTAAPITPRPNHEVGDTCCRCPHVNMKRKYPLFVKYLTTSYIISPVRLGAYTGSCRSGACYNSKYCVGVASASEEGRGRKQSDRSNLGQLILGVQLCFRLVAFLLVLVLQLSSCRLWSTPTRGMLKVKVLCCSFAWICVCACGCVCVQRVGGDRDSLTTTVCTLYA